jgi:hypothetical protein
MKYILPTISITILTILFIIIIGILIYISLRIDKKPTTTKVVKIIQKPDVIQNVLPRWNRWGIWNRWGRRRPVINQVITPLINPYASGCSGTRYGCCPDGVTIKNSDASNCGRRY